MAKEKNYKKRSFKEIQEEIKQYTDQAMNDIESHFNTPEEILEYTDFMSKFYHYSDKNMALIHSQFPGATAVGSYQKFKDAGFQVNKGEKGIKIFIPTPVTVFKAADGQQKSVSQATKEEKRQLDSGKLRTKQLTRFKLGSVFDVSQTDATAEDLPKIFPNRPYDMDYEGNPEVLLSSIKEVSESTLKVPVRDMDASRNQLWELGAAKGAFVQGPYGDEILMNPRFKGNEQIPTLIHEVVHAKMHKNSDLFSHEKEFQAELASYIVSKHFGIDTTEESIPYIAAWTNNAKKIENKAELIGQVHEAARELIEQIDNAYNQQLENVKEKRKGWEVDLYKKENWSLDYNYSVGDLQPEAPFQLPENRKMNEKLEQRVTAWLDSMMHFTKKEGVAYVLDNLDAATINDLQKLNNDREYITSRMNLDSFHVSQAEHNFQHDQLQQNTRNVKSILKAEVDSYNQLEGEVSQWIKNMDQYIDPEGVADIISHLDPAKVNEFAEISKERERLHMEMSQLQPGESDLLYRSQLIESGVKIDSSVNEEIDAYYDRFPDKLKDKEAQRREDMLQKVNVEQELQQLGVTPTNLTPDSAEAFKNLVVDQQLIDEMNTDRHFVSHADHLLKETLQAENKQNIDHFVSTIKSNTQTPLVTQTHFYRVEFNEGTYSYEGKVVTPELIEEIKSLEAQVAAADAGYSKFYFDEIKDGKIVDHFRMDVGDGVAANHSMYEALSQLAVSEETAALLVAQDIDLVLEKNKDTSDKEKQLQNWAELPRDAQNEILIIKQENPVNFSLALKKHGLEDVDSVFTGLNSFMTNEITTRYNDELADGVKAFNEKRDEWLVQHRSGDVMYIPENLWETADQLGMMDNYPKAINDKIADWLETMNGVESKEEIVSIIENMDEDQRNKLIQLDYGNKVQEIKEILSEVIEQHMLEQTEMLEAYAEVEGQRSQKDVTQKASTTFEEDMRNILDRAGASEEQKADLLGENYAPDFKQATPKPKNVQQENSLQSGFNILEKDMANNIGVSVSEMVGSANPEKSADPEAPTAASGPGKPTVDKKAPPAEKKPEKRKFVTKTEIAEAKSVSIVDFATSQGFGLVQSGRNEFRWDEHPSFVFDVKKNTWHWNSQDLHGGPIEFAQKMCDIQSFPEAVRVLNGKEYEKFEPKEIVVEPFVYDRSKESKDFSAARKYLVQERKLDPKIVDSLHKSGLLRQDERRNCLFCWNDSGKIVGLSEKGTGSKKWNKIHSGSQSETGFNFTIGQPKNLKFFEASIDAISYASMHKNSIQDTRFVAMEGLKKETVFDHLKKATEDLGGGLSSISICVDNDKAGDNFFEKNFSQFAKFKRESPEKPKEIDTDKWDWNDARKHQVDQFQKNMNRSKAMAADYGREMA